MDKGDVVKRRRGQKVGRSGDRRGRGTQQGVRRWNQLNVAAVLFFGIAVGRFSCLLYKVEEEMGSYEEIRMGVRQLPVDPTTNDNTTTSSTAAVLPILPMQHCEKYTTRSMDALEFATQTIHHDVYVGGTTTNNHSNSSSSRLQVSFSFLKGSQKQLAAHNLYPFVNYRNGFEGGVSYIWIAILQSLMSSADEYMVLDGGMNSGFYTALSAAMGFHVHAFELQRDCFDVVQAILESNPPSVQARAHLYNIGISNQVSIMQASEGCDPSYHLLNKGRGKKQKAKKKHAVVTLPLDLFLDQARQQDEHHASSKALQQKKKKKVAMLKLDIEGAEVAALQGLVRHLDAVQNVVLEFAPSYAQRFGVSSDQARDEFRRLEAAGFVPYKLWSFFLSRSYQQRNATYLQELGLETVPRHPILNTPMDEIDDYRMLWRIVDWDRFLAAKLKGCNVWFTRL